MQAKMNKSQDTPVHSYTEGFEQGFADGFTDGLHARMELEDTTARNFGSVEFETEKEELKYMGGFLDGLELAEYRDNVKIEALQKQVDFQGDVIRYGGSLATGITIAAILGYVKERKVHKQIVALIEETALILANEEVESRFVSFDELVSQVSIRLSEFEVRSFRRPFGIPAKELERTTSLLVGMLRTAETLGMQYVNFETANTVDVEPKE